MSRSRREHMFEAQGTRTDRRREFGTRRLHGVLGSCRRRARYSASAGRQVPVLRTREMGSKWEAVR